MLERSNTIEIIRNYIESVRKKLRFEINDVNMRIITHNIQKDEETMEKNYS